MNKKRFPSLILAVFFIVSALLISTACNGNVSPAASKSELSGSGTESLEDYFPDASETGSDAASEESQDSAASQDIEASSNGTSGTGASQGTSSSAPAPTTPAQAVVTNKYPSTPGETSTRKLPDFVYKLKNPVIKFLSSSILSEIQKEQLKAFESLTKIKLDIQVEVVPWESLPETVAKKVLANNSPDMFAIGAESTPYLVRQNYFQSVWDYINMNDALWKDVQNINYMAFSKGVQYAVTTSDLGIQSGLVYNKTLFDNNDLEYPYDLYKSGKWTWDALYSAAKEITIDQDNDGAPEVFGASIPDFVFGMVVNSTGADFIKYDAGGKIMNNLKDARIQRAADFIFKMGTLGYDSENWMWTNRFAQNKIGMVYGTPWDMISGPVLDMKKSGKVGWVPLPKDPKADKYYSQANTFFTYIPKNAKNPEAVAAWLYFQRYAIKNPSPVLEKNQKALAVTTWGWTEEEYQFIYKDISKQLSPVVGAGERVPDFEKQHYLWEMPFKNSWSSTLEEINPSFQAAIDAFNNR
ncbi:MAG: ABC transporter substrate-binding protein [Saccharofermentanales bacterium]